jgi:hypothetical protein
MGTLTWKAVYRDGFVLRQIDPDGQKNVYADIDQERLSAFELWDGDDCKLVMPFEAGERLIWRRRTAVIPGQGDETVHIVGRRRPVAEFLEVSSVACIFEADGRIISADSFVPEHEWLYPPSGPQGQEVGNG